MRPEWIFQPSIRYYENLFFEEYNRLPTGAHSVEDCRVANDDCEAGQGEAKQKEKHFGRSAKPRVEFIT